MKNLKLMNNKNGITLVALVVTIIILIILAGVSISMVLGENGLIAKAKVAKQKTEQAKLQEKASFSEAEDYIEAIGKQAGEKTSDLLNGETVVGEKIADGAGKVVPVPEGFYYVGGTVDKGAVISDNEADKNRYKGQTDVGKDLQGNQFVFVPVDGAKLKYEQDHTYDNQGKYQWEYTDYVDWKEDEIELNKNKQSVEKYKGFYIGRYEAGWPVEVTEGQNIADSEKWTTTKKIPVSKANVVAWNFVSQVKAKEISKKMYESNTKIASKLIDSYAWDTTCKWLINSGIVKETSDGNLISTYYGNYSNSSFTLQDVWYSKHIFLKAKEGSNERDAWYINKGGVEYYEKGNIMVLSKSITPPEGLEEKYTAIEHIEITTGSAEQTKTNNIYDLAGNMWEWTTETGKHEKSDGTKDINTFAVRRGGGFDGTGEFFPIVYRYANNNMEESGRSSWGFRVVLYIK